MRPGLSCMGWLRAPICYLDDYAHRWFPWTFSGHWADRVDQPIDPWTFCLERLAKPLLALLPKERP